METWNLVGDLNPSWNPSSWMLPGATPPPDVEMSPMSPGHRVPPSSVSSRSRSQNCTSVAFFAWQGGLVLGETDRSGGWVEKMISGWWLTYPSEKYESIGMIIPNIWENKKCSKPPTRFHQQETWTMVVSVGKIKGVRGIKLETRWFHQRQSGCIADLWLI